MVNRELLELAAKAVGIDWCAYHPDKIDNCSLCLQPNGKHWNPLTDNDDAFKLAVNCRLPLNIEDYQTLIEPLGIYEEHGNDPYTATRRAIVRAAAEIGKEIE